VRISRKGIGFIAIGAAAALQLAGAPAHAHHSIALQFNMNEEVTVTGTITRMDWRNPHAWLYVDVMNQQGEVEAWEVEFSSANALYRRGWRREDLPVGATVTIKGMPARDGSRTLGAEDVILPDGRTLFGGSADQQQGSQPQGSQPQGSQPQGSQPQGSQQP
jgi:hypothetical protein